MLKKIKKLIRHPNRVFIRTSGMIFAIFLYAMTFNLLLRPNNIVIGGMGGIAMILSKVVNLEIGKIVILLSFFLIVLGYIFLDRKIVIQNLLAAVCYPLFINMTSGWGEFIHVDHNEILIIVIFAGIMLGTSNGIVEKMGYFTGGTDILSKIVTKHFKTSTSNAILIVEGLVLFFGLLVYGNEQLIYAIVILYILSFVSSKIMLNISGRKVFYIYTDDTEDIVKYIHSSLGYDVTIIQNTRRGHHQSILMSVVHTRDYYALREGIEEIDPHAKIVIFDSYEYFERAGKVEEREALLEEVRNEHI